MVTLRLYHSRRHQTPPPSPLWRTQRALASALGVVASRVEAVTAGASSGFGSLAGAAATLTGAGDGGSGPGGGGGGGMSPELMDDLSKRLTTVEMKGIIQLTERGRRIEARAGALQAEKEDLFARLQVKFENINAIPILFCSLIGWFECDPRSDVCYWLSIGWWSVTTRRHPRPLS